MGLVPLFVLAHYSHHVLTALTVPLLPFIRNDFALDYTRSGMVISAFSLAYGFGFGALLLLLGVILMMRMPIAEAYIVSQSPEHLRSTILGIYFFSVIEGGGVLTPVVGYLIDQFGFYISFTICGAKMVIATLTCSLFLIPRARIHHDAV